MKYFYKILILFLFINIQILADEAPSTEPQPEPPPATERVVYITRTGQRYHLSTCRTLSQTRIAVTISEARRSGLTPCGTCRPGN